MWAKYQTTADTIGWVSYVLQDHDHNMSVKIYGTRPVARGGLVGSDELPSQIKGPLFCAKRSTF